MDMTSHIPKSASELAGIAEIAGQLGIETKNILKFTETMAMIGDATNLTSEEAGTSFARFANIVGMSQDDFDKLGSVTVALGNNLATTESQIVAMSMRLAGAGSQIGLTEAQILSFAGALSSVGIEAEAGGTSFSKVFSMLQLAVETGSEKLDGFAKVAGMSSKEFSKAFKDDASQAIIAFITGIGNVERNGKSATAVLDELGIKEAIMTQTLKNASNASGVFADAIELGNKAWEENNALLNEAEQRYGTTESQILLMKNQIQNASIEIGNALLPVIRDATEFIGKFARGFSNLDPAIKQTIIQFGLIGLGIGAFVLIGGTLMMFIGGCITAFTTLTGALAVFELTLGALVLPITVFILAITAIIGTVILVRKAWSENWLGIRDYFKGVIDDMIAWWKSFTEWISKPVSAVVSVFKNEVEIAKGNVKRDTTDVAKDKIARRNAYGGKITKNNELRRLHEGEQILTKQEASKLDRTGTGGGVTVAKLADTIIVREEADIDKIATALARKIKQQRLAFAGNY